MHEYENISTNQNALRKSDNIWTQNKTTESTWAHADKTVSLDKGIHEDNIYTDNNETANAKSLIRESKRLVKENTDEADDVSIGFSTELVHVGVCNTKQHPILECGKGLIENPTSGLQRANKTSYFDVKSGSCLEEIKYDLPGAKLEEIPKSSHSIHLKKYMNFKKKSLEGTEQTSLPMTICQPQTEEQSSICEQQQCEETVVDDEIQVLCNEQKMPCLEHSPTPNADDVLYKYMCIDKGANGQSKRNSYERLNKDTMEPRHKICQCRAHPGRTKTRKYRATLESQTKTSPETTPPMHPYIEAICQRTAEIMLQQLRSKPTPNEMVQISTIDRHVDGKCGLGAMVSGFVQPYENEFCDEHRTGSFDQEGLQSCEQINTIGRDSITYASGCHQSQHSGTCETSFCSFPVHVQSDVEQDTVQNEKRFEGTFCEGREPPKLSGIEENFMGDTTEEKPENQN